ncbi:MAG: YkgJ family cysteine cluster protein [Gloeobacteraceae cyanobacterium ES-bin-316]|nr:YkgJ family cysteine cluster protein [Ferruginibacter sp.]
MIAAYALAHEEENDAFRVFIKNSDGEQIDELVAELNEVIEPAVDCTQCGACCKMLMINVEEAELNRVSEHLQITKEVFKEKYIEESLQGQMIMSSIPCHFLEEKRCKVYEQRFSECREFPHLHKKNFQGRLFGTLVHYAMCPIIFNVVEELKVATGFKSGQPI